MEFNRPTLHKGGLGIHRISTLCVTRAQNRGISGPTNGHVSNKNLKKKKKKSYGFFHRNMSLQSAM